MTPAHQYPTGVTLRPAPPARADRLGPAPRGGLVVEDDYDGEFRYDRQPVGALQGTGARTRSPTSGTAAQDARARRCGWPGWCCRRGWWTRWWTPSATSTVHTEAIGQLTLAELIDSHGYDRHVRRPPARYRRRRDLLLAGSAGRRVARDRRRPARRWSRCRRTDRPRRRCWPGRRRAGLALGGWTGTGTSRTHPRAWWSDTPPRPRTPTRRRWPRWPRCCVPPPRPYWAAEVRPAPSPVRARSGPSGAGSAVARARRRSRSLTAHSCPAQARVPARVGSPARAGVGVAARRRVATATSRATVTQGGGHRERDPVPAGQGLHLGPAGVAQPGGPVGGERGRPERAADLRGGVGQPRGEAGVGRVRAGHGERGDRRQDDHQPCQQWVTVMEAPPWCTVCYRGHRL